MYQLIEQEKEITVSELARGLKLSNSTVSNMIKRLASDKLVITQAYKPISFTSDGLKKASSVVAKHRMIELFLVKFMDFHPDQVHPIAEELEHVNAPEFFIKMQQMTKDNIDPHGSIIPSCDFRFN
jgi:DtxR family transcriptional regulator, Mn-dependent transcriptional regulator